MIDHMNGNGFGWMDGWIAFGGNVVVVVVVVVGKKEATNQPTNEKNRKSEK